MGFRLDLTLGCGKAKYWEVLCDHCEMIEHFPIDRFPDFPAAFHRAMKMGWDVVEDTRKVARYSCPTCAAKTAADLKRRGEG